MIFGWSWPKYLEIFEKIPSFGRKNFYTRPTIHIKHRNTHSSLLSLWNLSKNDLSNYLLKVVPFLHEIFWTMEIWTNFLMEICLKRAGIDFITLLLFFQIFLTIKNYLKGAKLYIYGAFKGKHFVSIYHFFVRSFV